MNNVKAIFLDMDGTILHENNKASNYTKDVVDELREKGFKVFLATGRSYSEIHQLVPEGFKVDGIISSNGTTGEIEDQNLFKHSLSLEQVKKIVKLAQQQHIYYEVFPFGAQRIVLKEDYQWMRDMITGETPPNNVSHSEWTSRLDAMKDKIDWRDELPDLDYSKIYLFNPNLDKITTFRDELIQNKVLLSISVSNSSRYNAETMAYNTDKGTGIKEMIEHFGIQQEETLVIGDSDNDRAMFDFGQYTVAMKNARQEIKDITDEVTEETNEEDGAAKYLKSRLLDK
ncbi:MULTISPECIES: Cof-type HAD-IIB family hydrolase [Staphylococcus]|jgi:cof-like hydrolase|uniref:Cof-type HAD-IIB family hydrolase n=1 Tax=Staphylococcus capitis TaxID=29388 RepID=A0A4V6KJT0_STACP|nr:MULTISPECIES: Cof-type HAD-IIB family hydrolase [Staphylococcus]EFS16885.1 putative hydrolase [Staphylococcus capitis C87]MBC3050265.1 Cof-type HAD-IIB family hydrolase [Staphylococcus capitis]MBC3070171.1 Cof-type HAD-IIB family hydrolase [Staphylococcus capitis]MBC3072426.1 Cof-type HAD-IIB family hydrolase [Staphylococcus capitis]MBC3081081.1 Cof-type HAD-IIB family hydrolase [Staphylococcus capitis]